MKSFRDLSTNVLKAFGNCEANAPGDLARDEPDDFALTPGEWQLVNDVWNPYFAMQKKNYLEEVRTTRERILNRLAGIAAAAIVAGDTAMQQAFVSARESLLNITDDPSVAAATDMGTLKSAVLSAYRNICASAPASIVSAFNTVDQ